MQWYNTLYNNDNNNNELSLDGVRRKQLLYNTLEDFYAIKKYKIQRDIYILGFLLQRLTLKSVWRPLIVCYRIDSRADALLYIYSFSYPGKSVAWVTVACINNNGCINLFVAFV